MGLYRCRLVWRKDIHLRRCMSQTHLSVCANNAIHSHSHFCLPVVSPLLIHRVYCGKSTTHKQCVLANRCAHVWSGTARERVAASPCGRVGLHASACGHYQTFQARGFDGARGPGN